MSDVRVLGARNLAVPALWTPEATARYEHDTVTHMVGDNGLHYTGKGIDFNDTPENIQQSLLEMPDLAWISFYARVVVDVRHSAHIGPSMPGETESIHSSKRIKVGNSQFVVERIASGPGFLTHNEIIKEGALRPFMSDWLGRMTLQGRHFESETDPFLPLLEEQ